MEGTWLGIVKNLAHHPRTETVLLPSGCSLVPQSNQVRKSPKQNLELKNKQPVTPRLTILIGAETSWLGVAVTWDDLGVLDEHIHRRPPLPHLLVYPLLKSDAMP